MFAGRREAFCVSQWVSVYASFVHPILTPESCSTLGVISRDNPSEEPSALLNVYPVKVDPHYHSIPTIKEHRSEKLFSFLSFLYHHCIYSHNQTDRAS